MLLQRDAGNSPDSRVKLLDDKSCANILKAGRIAVKREESKRKRLGRIIYPRKNSQKFYYPHEKVKIMRVFRRLIYIFALKTNQLPLMKTLNGSNPTISTVVGWQAAIVDCFFDL